MDIKLMISIFPSLLSGAVITLQLLVSSMFFGLIIGLIFAIFRINKNPIINKFAYGYSYFFSHLLNFPSLKMISCYRQPSKTSLCIHQSHKSISMNYN